MKRLSAILLSIAIAFSLMPISALAEDDILYKNIAVGKNVITNSRYSDSYHERNIVDGSYTTNYSATGSVFFNDAPVVPRNSQYAIIDLGALYNIYNIKLYSRADVDNKAHRTNLCIQATNDPTFQTWTTIASSDYIGDFKAVWRVDFEEALQYRYIKPSMVNADGSHGALALAELEVFGEKAVSSASTSSTFDDITIGDRCYNAVNLVSQLGIMNRSDENIKSFGRNMLITRAEACKIIALSMGNMYIPSGEFTGYIYEDVSHETDCAEYIKFCKERGIVSDADKFNPDRYVTAQEFIKMLLSAMGYSTVVEGIGTYPSNYIKAANDIKIIPSGCVMTESLTREFAAMILYEALNAPIMEMKPVYDGATANKGKSYIEHSFGFILRNGIVEANNVTNLRTDSAIAGVRIAGKDYQDEKLLLNNLLAYKVYFVTDDENNIVAGWKDNRNDFLEIKCSDVESVSDGIIKYYRDAEKRNTKTIRTENFADLAILKNGVAFNGYTTETFKTPNGRIELIDNDNDNVFDCVNIYEPKIIIVNNLIDITDENRIALYGVNNQSIDISDYTNMHIYKNGTEVSTDSIGEKSVVYAYVSDNGKNVVLEVSSNRISGKLTTAGSDVIYIDNAPYYISEHYRSNISDFGMTVSPGNSYTFLLNDSNEVVWVLNGSSNAKNEIVGLVMNLYKNDIDECYRAEIYDENGNFNYYNLKKRITIDGNKYSVSQLDTFISNNPDYFTNGMVHITLADESEISLIKTSNIARNSEIYQSAQCSAGYYKTRGGISSSGTFIIPLKEDVPVFTIPVDENGEIINDDNYKNYYSVSTLDTLYGVNTRRIDAPLNFYGVGQHGEPSYAIRKLPCVESMDGIRPLTTQTYNLMIIRKISDVVSGDEITKELSGYDVINGKEITFVIKSGITGYTDSSKIACVINEIIPGIGGLAASDVKQWYNGNILDPSKFDTTRIGYYCSTVDELRIGDVVRYNATGEAIIELERLYSIDEYKGVGPYDCLFALNDGIGKSYVSQFKVTYSILDSLTHDIMKFTHGTGTETLFYNKVDSPKFYLYSDGYINLVDKSELVFTITPGSEMLTVAQSGSYKAFIFYE